MSFSVALRVDSGIFLYSLGRRRADMELEANDRLANSVTDTTDRLELDVSLLKGRVGWRSYTSKSGQSGFQGQLSERQVMCPKQDA